MEADDIEELRVCMGRRDNIRDEYGISGCEEEFAGYRVLLHVLPQESGGGLDVQRLLAKMPAELRKSKEVVHAVKVWKSVLSKEYVTFFKLYQNAPNMSAYLMDELADRMREHMISCIVQSYRLRYPLKDFMKIACLPTTDYALPLLRARKVNVTASSPYDIDIDATRAASSSNLAANPSINPPAAAQNTANKHRGLVAKLKAAVTEARTMSAGAAEKGAVIRRLLRECKELLQQPSFQPSLVSSVELLLSELESMKKSAKKLQKKQNGQAPSEPAGASKKKAKKEKKKAKKLKNKGKKGKNKNKN